MLQRPREQVVHKGTNNHNAVERLHESCRLFLPSFPLAECKRAAYMGVVLHIPDVSSIGTVDRPYDMLGKGTGPFHFGACLLAFSHTLDESDNVVLR